MKHYPTTIRQRLQQMTPSLTPSERKLVSLLTGANPALALGTANQLAEQAGVSPPTVVRFAVKLGFEGFPDFQRAWVAELESRLTSPLSILPDHQPDKDESGFAAALSTAVTEAVDNMVDLPPVLDLLADTERRIYLRGGRFSHGLAEYMHGYLRQLRRDVCCLSGDHGQDVDLMLDIRPRDVLVLFDYRHYQTDVMIYANRVAECRATLVLFTDRWLSPAAPQAAYIFVAPVAVPSPFDTMAPAMAQVEYLSRALFNRFGDQARERIRRLAEIRDGTPAGTLDSLRPMVPSGKLV